MYANILVILVVLLKNGSTHQIIKKEDENKSMIALKKDKIITKIASTFAESFLLCTKR